MLIQAKVKKFDLGDRYWVDIIEGNIYTDTSNEPKVLFTSENRGGYKKVKLYDINNKKHMMFVHRVVLESYMHYIYPDVNELDLDNLTIDHIDFNPRNNNIFNLRYMYMYDNNSRKSYGVEFWDKNLSDKLFTMYFINFVPISEIVKDYEKLGKKEVSIYTALQSDYAKKWCKEKGIPFIRRQVRNQMIDNEENSERIKEYIKKVRQEKFERKTFSLPEEVLNGVCKDYFIGSPKTLDVVKIKRKYSIPLRSVYIILRSDFAKTWCKLNNVRYFTREGNNITYYD